MTTAPNLPLFTQSEQKRLTKHLARVLDLTSDGNWHSLHELARAGQMLETSASARLRDLRKMGYTVDKRQDQNTPGLWWYRVFAGAAASM